MLLLFLPQIKLSEGEAQTRDQIPLFFSLEIFERKQNKRQERTSKGSESAKDRQRSLYKTNMLQKC